MSAEDVVITGLSGRFSNCKNVAEYKAALLENRDVVTRDHDRWDYKYWGTPPTLGTVPDFHKFDAGFFGVNPKMANAYDPKLRKLLEVVYEALVDSGTNVTELRGSHTGLYLGITQNFCQPPEEIGGVNNNLTVFMIANTISYCFDFQGPSMAIDTGCASSNYVMSLAFEGIRSGQCEQAIVCGAQSQLLPFESVDFTNFGVLTHTGYCTPFDKNRSGYIKSDCIVALFLQKRAVANRIYMTVEATGTNVDGYKETGANRPSWDKQYALLDQTYARYKVNPGDICYLECHGTATVVGDSEECKALARFFANRKEPLLVGSCKSNIGHAESTSGLAALVKLIIATQTGIIPATIHLKTLDPQLEGFSTGTLKVVTENRPHPYGLMAINSFGFGGANGHVIVNPFNEKNKSSEFKKSTLVRVSARTKEAVEQLLDGALKNSDNHAFISLMNNAFKKPIKNHPYRGYQVIGKDDARQIATVSSKKRPIWFCYTGMGSQYVGMAKDMMQYPVFRETLKKSCSALKPYGLDLEDVILNGTKETFENIVNCFASVVAMSIALTDVLTSIGIVPDGIFGHSLGETACAYVDGHITAEEATLIGWARGNSSKTTPLQPGLMAAIGLSYEKLTEILPKDIEVAAINCNDNCTISGPTQSVKDFLEYCSQNNIFARLVQTGNLAYHCKYIHPSGDKFLKFVQGIIKKRTKRSSKWLSSSVPEAEWNTDLAIYNSAEYHHNNYMNKVLFKQVLDKVPKDAILIEIAPRGLLQAILKRHLPETITNIPLLSNLDPDNNYNFFLSSVGRIYNAGGCPDITPLLPPVTYPVGIDTPMIGPLVKWDHELDWHVTKISREQIYGQIIELDLAKTENKYLFDHIVDGIAILPGAGYLDLAWTGFSRMKGRIKNQFPVVLKNVKIIEATLLNENAVLKFVVNIMRTSGKFEILLNNKVASTGYIFELLEDEFSPISTNRDPKAIIYDRDEAYRYGAVRGYDHVNTFQVIKEFNITDGNLGKIEWDDNWVTYLDGFVSYLVLYERRGLYLPMDIEKVIINPVINKEVTDKDENPTVYYNKYTRTARCAGVECKNITGKKINIKIKDEPVYKSYKFTPFSLDDIDENVAHDLCFQTVLQNNLARANFKFLNYDFTEDLNSIKNLVPLRHWKYLNLASCVDLTEGILNNVNLLLLRNFLEKNVDDAKKILSWLPKTSFVYTNTNGNISEEILSKLNVSVVSKFKNTSGCFVLLRQKQDIPTNYTIIKINDNKFNWVKEYTSAVNSGKERIYIVSNYVHSGVLGFMNCVKEEYHTKVVRIYFFKQDIKEEFSPTSKFFKDRLELDLAVNVYDKNTWGAYMHWDMPRVAWKNVTYAGLFKQKNLAWQEEPVYNRCEANEVVVRYALVHKWQLESIRLKNLGLEYTGIDRSGNTVMGITPTGSLKTIVEKVPELTWTIPKSWQMSQAACLPLALTMTYYGLFIQESLSERHNILIVDENNNFTNMAILFALRTGCLTFVVTDCDTRVTALQKCYPKLQNNILKYTNISALEESIMKNTEHKGVDFIFQKVYSTSWNLQTCLAKKGKIIILSMEEQSSRSDDAINSIVELKDFLKDLRILNKIHKEIELMIQTNLINPDVFKCDETAAENVKEYFENNKETKFVLAKINGENVTSVSNVHKVKSIARTYFDPKKVYIVIGGLGGFGLELANWMVSRGAQRLVINSRSGVKTNYQAHYIRQWTNQGVIVKTDSHNTITYDGCKQLLEEASKLGPVDGIFNSALVLRDNLSHELTEQDFVEVVGPKLYSAEHMDKLTRQLCPNLEYFVLISSVASSLGHPGQSNYAYANSAMEMLCEQRQKDNLPAVAIEWGPVGQVGFFAKQKNKKLFFDAIVQNIHSCLDALDFFIQQDQKIVSSVVYQKDSGDNKDKSLTSVLDSIAILFGIKSLTEAHMNTTLVNLGMDSITGFEVRNIVMAQFNVDYSAKELRNMTFADIKNLQKS